MKKKNENLSALRRMITENLRIQRGGADPVPYIDVSNILDDICARQNHVIFARRGCGKTLLLHHSSHLLIDSSIKAVYLNCEDFKRHSFPNVLIEILDALFAELERHLPGWFGKKKRSRELISNIRRDLAKYRLNEDRKETEIVETFESEKSGSANIETDISEDTTAALEFSKITKAETERRYQMVRHKLEELDLWLPRLKAQIREFFELSKSVKAVFLQIDDFYHLKRGDQPLVMDYIHRLCKDVPLYFKVATLRHATNLYADRDGQPIGAQERHDYQPVNIDYTFSDFNKTKSHNKSILYEFGKLAKMRSGDIDDLFKGQGFDRLVMAGGGVPRDCLSLFLEIIGTVQSDSGDGKIGKDDVRILSRSNFERRIDELKQDSEGGEQDSLIRGIYVFRQFCIDKETNIFLVSEQLMQQKDRIRDLIYRLLDYRIIHSAGSALTHKSQSGTYQAFAIDIGCYAHLRKLHGKFKEIDFAESGAKEKMRSAPILDESNFESIWVNAPKNPLASLLVDE